MILVLTLAISTSFVVRDSRLVVLNHECAAHGYMVDGGVCQTALWNQNLWLFLTSTPGDADEGSLHFEKQ